MRKYRFRIIIIALSLGLGVYYLWPTYKDYQLHKTLNGLSGKDSLDFIEKNEAEIRDARAKRIKLGLDLQGGMRVVLEVNVLKLIEDLAKNKDDVFARLVGETAEEVRKSDESAVSILRKKFETRQIRMSRYYRSLRETNDEITTFLDDETKKAIDRAMEIVRNRVDQYGVSEPSIQKLGGSRIIVELPGVTKESEVRQLLQGTALLEFKLLKEPEQAVTVMQAIDKALAETGVTDSTANDTSASNLLLKSADSTKNKAEKDMTPEEFKQKHPWFGIALVDNRAPGEAIVEEENKDKIRRIFDREDVQRIIPSDMQFLFSAKPRFVSEGKKYFTLYPVKANPELTGGVISNARWTIDQNTNQPIVTMEMDNTGSKDWARITGANINERIAIVLDNAVFSAPVVRNKIIGGHSQIEGMESQDEAKLLEIVLKAGALPAPVEIVEQRSVGASLGEDSIHSGLLSSGLATLLTIIFMVMYYRTGGVVADVAVVFCMVLLLGILAAFHGTLTLPGIAGIILTLAVAVDANVLIYERVREEQATGKTLRAAIDAGYQKAFTAIFDSNLTTFITGLILFQFGTGPVQGFALTLMIGIAASMFSAIFITRVIFNILTDKSSAAVNFG
ncbi:MAG: protein translocase subunit SecD [Bacteroidota bacterium]